MRKLVYSVCLTLAFGLLMLGCGKAETMEEKTTISKSEKTTDDQSKAVEFDESVSDDEKNNFDISEYRQYEDYGLNYDKDKERFYYNGKLVRRFKDVKDREGNINGFSFENGEIDLKVDRDTSYKLIGISVLSQEEFDKNTEEMKLVKSLDATAHEEGDDKVGDDTLNEYQNYGVSYDEKQGIWKYNETAIYVFYDENGSKIIQGDVDDKKNVSLIVERDAQDKIVRISEIDSNDISTYVKKLLDTK